jgi:hypothetical protein
MALCTLLRTTLTLHCAQCSRFLTEGALFRSITLPACAGRTVLAAQSASRHHPRSSQISCVARTRRRGCNRTHGNKDRGSKSRELIFGGALIGADIRARAAREQVRAAIRAADRAEAKAWSIRMEGFGGPVQPSPTIGQCLNGGLGWLEVKCNRCNTREPVAKRHPPPPPVHMIKPTERQRSRWTNGRFRRTRDEPRGSQITSD